MPHTQSETFTLTPHPAARSHAVHNIGGHVSRLPNGTLSVTYVLAGDIDRIRLPAPHLPRFADNLWQHTCCELFIRRQGEATYREFNFSPSGEWAAYAFERTRARISFDANFNIETLDPQIAVRIGAKKIELDATIRLDRLSPLYTGAALALGLSAVVEDTAGALSYWALKHPLDKPDFHHPDAFVLELDEIRN